MRRSALWMSPEMQAMMKVMAAWTPRDVEAARVVVACGWSMKEAAEVLKVSGEALRQRMMRVKQRVMGEVGKEWWVPVRRAAVVSYGAEERAYRWAGEKEGWSDES